MFWGLVLEPYKKYTQKVDQSFHISQAALDLTSCNQSHESAQLVVEYENSNFILATLSKKANIFQVPLDLIFKTGDQISFRVIGSGKVHLSGYHVLEDLDNMIMNGEEESDLDEIDIEEEKRKRKKATPKSKGGKKVKVDDSNEEESDEDFVFDEDDDDDDDDDEEDDEDDDEDDEDEEKVAADKKAKKKKKNFGEDLDIDDEESDDEEDEDDEDDVDDEDDEDFDDEDDEDDIEEEKTPKSGKKKKVDTPNGLPTSTKGSKTEQKLNKSLKDVIPGTPKKTPQKDLKLKNDSTKKNVDREATPKGKKNDLSKGGDKSPKEEGSPQKKVLEGGVIAEELKVGNGPIAKPGKMANVYYVGTLATTKKQFDAVQNGPGFKFRIGRNEVIKGWDIGLNGMKVGGKRRLTIPPHLAYGSKGSPPVIPPNSTLVFTVELKGLS